MMVWECFEGRKLGDLVEVKGILQKKQYHSILQRHTILYLEQESLGRRSFCKSSFCSRTMTRNTRQSIAKTDRLGVLRIME